MVSINEHKHIPFNAHKSSLDDAKKVQWPQNWD